MWLLRAPAVTARLETDFLKPVPIGTVLHITAQITGQVNRKVYSEAVGRLNGPDGEIAVRAAALFVIVPMKHFLENAPADYMEALKKNPHLLTFVDPEFNINP
jgi:acyl-CoA thioesterase FadM